ncbi:MAG: hypothetical protein AABX91_02425 [Nanoarchaeota archaeon]
MRKGLLKRAVINSSVAACLVFLGGEIYGRVLSLKYGDEMEEMVRDVREKQKGLMNLQSFGEPKMTFNPVFGIFGRKRFPRGSYSHFFDMIWVNRNDADKEGVVAHETGHEYHSKVTQNLGLRNNLYKNVLSNFTITREIVSEGIAEYFEAILKSNTKSPVMSSERLEKKSLKDYEKEFKHPNCYYEVGFRLVKPILDVNVDRGIEALARNPLTEKDLEDLISYQQRVLRIVEQNSSKVKITTKP